ncbi:unnamed protein product [Amoebophrya sp. A120]|nr:unnamed protein product [Amoebophrya sp. A120]|eukprot:GSA120T00010722001.1
MGAVGRPDSSDAEPLLEVLEEDSCRREESQPPSEPSRMDDEGCITKRIQQERTTTPTPKNPLKHCPLDAFDYQKVKEKTAASGNKSGSSALEAGGFGKVFPSRRSNLSLGGGAGGAAMITTDDRNRAASASSDKSSISLSQLSSSRDHGAPKTFQEWTERGKNVAATAKDASENENTTSSTTSSNTNPPVTALSLQQKTKKPTREDKLRCLSPKSRAEEQEDRRQRIQRKKRLANKMAQHLTTPELRKEAGSAAFRDGDWEMAIIQWTKALTLLGQASSIAAGIALEREEQERKAGISSTSSTSSDNASGRGKGNAAPSQETQAELEDAGGATTCVDHGHQIKSEQQLPPSTPTAHFSQGSEDAEQNGTSTATSATSGGEADECKGAAAAATGGSADAVDTENEKDKQIAAIYSNRSAAHANLAEYTDSLRDAKLAIHFNPLFPRAYARKGAALFFLGRVQEARDAYFEGMQVCNSHGSCTGSFYSSGPGAAAAAIFGNMGGAQRDIYEALKQGMDDCDLLLDVTLVKTRTLFANRSAREYFGLLVNPLELKSWNLWILYVAIVFSMVCSIVKQVHGY